MRRSSKVLAALGVVLIALAAIVKFAVVPAVAKLPGDADTTAQYVGKATMLDAKALQAGDVANALARDLDVTIDRHVYVSETDGNTAVVHDDSTIRTGGQDLADARAYAIDRTSMEAAAAPDGVEVEDHTGLTVAMPMNPSSDDSYTLWDPSTKSAAPVRYVGAETREGRNVNYYEATASGALKNPSLQNSLPSALPRALATQMLPLLPAETQQTLQAVAGSLPETMPLTYTANTDYGVWADSQLGSPIESTIHRTVTANIDLNGQLVPLLPVLDIDVKSAPDSVKSSADKANEAGRTLSLLSVWVPLALLVIGLLLVAVAILRRRSENAV